LKVEREGIEGFFYADIPEEHIRSILKAMGKSRADLRKFLGQ
jgi:hypothetical protein